MFIIQVLWIKSEYNSNCGKIQTYHFKSCLQSVEIDFVCSCSQFICLSITIPVFCHFKRRGLGYK